MGQSYFWFAATVLSFESLPVSDVGFEGEALAEANSPSSPRRMILRGRTAGGGGVSALVSGAATLASDSGTLT